MNNFSTALLSRYRDFRCHDKLRIFIYSFIIHDLYHIVCKKIVWIKEKSYTFNIYIAKGSKS